MLPAPQSLVTEIIGLHRECVVRWHLSPPEDPDTKYDGLFAEICEQHRFNFLLWHEEDIARSPDASDKQIAAVKRAIDGYNQQRNDAIERVDEALVGLVAAAPLLPSVGARWNTETPGGAIDRLSIMSLRIYHYEEQLTRDDGDQLHSAKVLERLTRCRTQQADLEQSLAELFADIFAGRKLLKVYRQMKMYNDPMLNPYLYRTRRLAG